jgi:class 3 adenylate cyclase/tetratricopeptide (TPR) repeat protein
MQTIPGHPTACAFENPPGAMFCGSCGQPLYKTCGRCATEVPAGFSFCTACGTAVGAGAGHHGAAAAAAPNRKGVAEPPPLPIADAAASERKLVSVVFCDLVDSTAMEEGMDSEDVREILSRYFEAVREVVRRHDGSIEKFIGDAVVAVWGSPITREDDAERAVRAALEMVEAVHQLRPAGLSRPLAARAAVATGESSVSMVLEGQGMVAGDIVNTAARLQSVAEPGTVLMNDATRRATASTIVARPAGRQRLKGKALPIHSWRAIRLARPRPNAKVSPTPMVGRHRELQELLSATGGAVRRRHARLISIVGVAGIGKSRLLDELHRRLQARLPNLEWHTGRAPRDGAGTAFAPLADMVRQGLHIGTADASPVARAKLHAALPKVTADAAERGWIEPRLAVLIDPDEVGQYQREELFAAWRRYFELLAERSPIVLVFEDAHRTDPGLLDFAEYVVETSRDRPEVVVTVARPDLLEARPAWGAGLRSFTGLHLEKLPDPDMRRLLTGLRPGLSAEVLSQVLRRADGVPLYAVELTRMLQDSRSDGANRDELPASLRALIASRLDSLPTLERTLLMSAAVLGRTFTADSVTAVAATDPAAVGSAVERLIRQQVLARETGTRIAVGRRLLFREQLVQDVAYRTLARAERRRLHVRAADHLESLNDEELVEVVADHLVKAYGADPAHPEAATIASRAIPALARAARRAQTLNAPDRALVHLRDALAMEVDDVTRAQLTEEAAAAAQAAGRFEAAEPYWREAIERRSALGDRVGAARATARLTGLLLIVQRNDAAMREVETALQDLGDIDADDPAGVELAGQLARVHLLRGDGTQAVSWADRALAGAEALGLAAVATDARITRGAARGGDGDVQTARADLEAAIAECGAEGLFSLELRARNNLAWLLVADDPRRTVEAARAGFETGRRTGIQDMALQLGTVAFATAIDTGEWDWAQQAIDSLADEPMSPAHRIDIAATASILRGLRGQRSADRPLAELEPLAPDTDPQLLAQVSAARAWLALLRGRFSVAHSQARKAAGGAVGFNRHAALILAGRAALWAGDAAKLAADLAELGAEGLTGRSAAAAVTALRAGEAALASDQAAAEEAWAGALATWRQLDLPFPLLLSLLERAKFLRGNPDRTEVNELVQRLGAKGLARLL